MKDNTDDLRQRLQQLEKMAEEYARIEALVDAAERDQPMDFTAEKGVLYVDPAAKRIVDANAAASEFLGYSADALLKLSITDLEIPDPNATPTTYIKNGVKLNIYRCAYRHAEGHLLPVEVCIRQDKDLLHYTLEDQSLHKRLWRELQRRGEPSISFQERLKALNELTIELSRIEQYDSLCWHTIKLGVERLGFNRLAMWFIDTENGVMRGSYGVDESGRMRAEHHVSWRYENTEVSTFLAGNTEAALAYDQVPIFNDKSEIIEYGWHITAPMLHGDRLIGVLTADNYLHKQPMKEYEPELLRLYGITVGHLTELTRARDQTFAMRLEQERTHMLRQFITHVGHDFRTPLTTINTKCYLMQRTQEADKRAALAKSINQQVGYISHTLDDMRDFIAMESSLSLTPVPTDLHSLLNEIISNGQTTAEAKQIQCELVLENVPPIISDPHYLQRALSEIFENALQYTPPGGRIQISVARYPYEIGIRIRDTGIGIEQDALDKVFKPLYRVDEARTERRSGLGLSIAKTIVEAHHGRIVIQSTPGKGSTFEVILPNT